MFGPCAIFLLPTEFFRAPTELLSRGRAGGLVDLLSLLGASVYLDLSLKNGCITSAGRRRRGPRGLAAPALAKLESGPGIPRRSTVGIFRSWVQGGREMSPIMRWFCLTMRIQGGWNFGKDNRRCLGLDWPPQHVSGSACTPGFRADNFERVMLWALYS